MAFHEAAALLVAAAAILGGGRPEAQEAAPDGVVAVVAGRPLSRRELAAAAEPRLIELRTQEYELQRRALERLIEERLLLAEAERRGITPDALLKAEVEAKAVAPGRWDVDAYQKSHAKAYEGMGRDEARRAAEAALRADRVLQRRIGFLNELRAAAGVRVLLEPPRVAVDAGAGATRGPADARVTLVEFADFQCPYCGRLASSLKRLVEKRPGQVRLAFRHLPLANHRHATKAAEAAECAREQGRFWEMHDRLFTAEGRLEAGRLKQEARGLGLDVAAFDRCLDGGAMAARWREDQRVAEGLGLTATPMLFVNGRLVVGARPDDELLRIVDEELKRP